MNAAPSQTDIGGRTKQSGPALAVVVTGIVCVFVLWGVLGLIAFVQPKPGEFGDMFGAANALFSGLAFAGLIYAIWLQRLELQLQREELVATRAELRGQKEQLEAQNRTLRKQSFENTFYQLLRLHNDIVNAIALNRVTLRGRDCFQYFFNELQNDWANRMRGGAQPSLASLHFLNEIYMGFYRGYESQLGHYFRSLYNTVKLVHDSEMEDKRLYTNLVRAQLSSYELLVLFYNSLSEMGREKFKPLIVEYDLLKHLPRDKLFDPNHASLY